MPTRNVILPLFLLGRCDLDCGSTYKKANLQLALTQGLLTMGDVDTALGRVMRMRFRAGMFDQPAAVPYTKIGLGVMNSKAGRALALRAAVESIVLLKNAKGVLPFGPRLGGKANWTLAVVGPVANVTSVMMGGKNDYCPAHTVSLCQGLRARGKQAGVAVTCSNTGDASLIAGATQGADAVVLAVGGIFGHEASDRTVLTLPDDQTRAIAAAIHAARAGSKPLVLLVVNGDPIAMDSFKDKVDTLLDVFEGGQAAGTAAGRILFGDVSPSGMMPFTTYPASFVSQVKMSDMGMRPSKVRVARRSIPPRWGSIRFGLAPRTYDAPPRGPLVRVVSQTKS